MMVFLYRLATSLGGPLIRLYLARRKARGKEHATRFAERLGIASLERPQGTLIWVHCASVGESVSMLPLVDHLLGARPDARVMMTTGTMTSAALMEKRLPDRAFHQFIPVDRIAYVRRFLDHWKPDLALWAESEFWPNLVLETSDRNIALVLLNGRVSDRSFARWQKYRTMIATLLGRFALCFGQTDQDAERLSVLGALSVVSRGNLKFASPALPADAAKLEALNADIGVRPRWLAASTHDGEEALIGALHGRLKAKHAGLLSLIVPRHPERGGEIAKALRDDGLNVSLRSVGETIDDATDVYVADTLGELGLFYRLCDIVFVGRSLVPLGGQNPLEPARLGCAVTFGPHTFNFTEISAQMIAADAAKTVDDAAALEHLVDRWLADPKSRNDAAARSKAFAAAQAGVLDAVMADLTPLLGGTVENDHARA